MTDVTQTLVDQVENLPTNGEVTQITGENSGETTDLVRKSDVIDLIYGVEDDLYDMSDRRALQQVQWLLHSNLDESLQLMWEIEDVVQDAEGDPFVQMYSEILGSFYLDVLENHIEDVETAIELVEFEHSKLQ